MFKVRTLELVLNMDYLTCFLILMGVKSLFQVSIVLSVFESACRVDFVNAQSEISQ